MCFCVHVSPSLLVKTTMHRLASPPLFLLLHCSTFFSHCFLHSSFVSPCGLHTIASKGGEERGHFYLPIFLNEFFPSALDLFLSSFLPSLNRWYGTPAQLLSLPFVASNTWRCE
uniref:Uncharacterized protein n=1 Tax=Trypanosoma congolense (strain IL3000) TaxID=1068625 RepID=G0US50_TRYCI|nr:hypothetical protein, unlikely [Trypanosoma congolense IL3000]